MSAGTEVMSPVALFAQADIVVKAVMIGLLLASIWTWAIIVTESRRLSRELRESRRFEGEFWAAEDIDAFHSKHEKNPLSAARLLASGIREWRRSTGGKSIDRDGTRQRLGAALGTATAAELDRLSDRLNILATVGSVAPFVGLFGTVWGIMRAFTAIAGANDTSLAVVAPGIAEALFATAIGLFAAIPAVIAYNRLTHRVNQLDGQLTRFGDRFHATLSRELELEA